MFSFRSWWNALWSASIPPKVKIFRWRFLNDIIPTPSNLRRNHIYVIPACGLCGSSVETTMHSLFLCPVIKPLSKASFWSPCLEMAKKGYVIDLALWARDTWNRKAFEVFTLCVWETWNIRNSLIHGSLKHLSG
ncbi:hypothetical protein UlMin_023143 [Ulmus minor]